MTMIALIFLIEVEPLTRNPQLKSERTFDETSDLEAAIYFDITTPSLQKAETP